MRKNVEVKRIDLFSLFKIAFMIFAGLGLLGGFIAAFILLMIGGIGNAFMLEEEMIPVGLLGGVVGIIVIPLVAMFFYGSVGSIGATIVGAVYNLVARFAGGVKLEISSPDLTVYPESENEIE